MKTKRIPVAICILAVLTALAISGTTLADRAKPKPTRNPHFTAGVNGTVRSLPVYPTVTARPTESTPTTCEGAVEQVGVLVCGYYGGEQVTATHVTFPQPFHGVPLVHVFFPDSPGLSLVDEGVVIAPWAVTHEGFDVFVMRQRYETAGAVRVGWRAIAN